jgi:sugar lactone lactonase YvrE
MQAKAAIFALLTAGAIAGCAAEAPAREPANTIAASYPEGPLWRGDKLYYAEMGADRIAVYERGEVRTFFTEAGCGPTAIAPYRDGFLVLCHVGARLVAVNADGQAVRRWSADDRGVALQDPNDGYEDGQGGVYFSDPGLFSRATFPHGRVMHLTAEGALLPVAGPLWYPNGVYTDVPRHILYVDEHMAGHVLRYDIHPDGSLGDPSVYVDINAVQRPRRYRTPYAETGPDGLEMGPDGDMFVAIYGEGRILRFSPDARLVGMIELPTRYSTNIAFDAQGNAATTGTFENLNPPYPGEVRFHPASSLTRRGG